MNELLFQPIASIGRLIKKRSVSSVELTRAALDHIENLEPLLNAFITVRGDDALASASRAEAEIGAGAWRGPLHGIPISIKDNIAAAGWPTTCASKILAEHITDYDATVVARLRHAGAIILGKNNLHEFAMGGTSANGFYGSVHNPWKLDYVPGGSSGGSAAAVSAGETFASVGTDGRGSIRTPASYCGVVGFKPTVGLVSHFGEVPPSSTRLCSLGPICRTVTDAAMMLNILAGYDENDPSSIPSEQKDYVATLEDGVKGLRLGLVTNYFYDETLPEVKKAVIASAGALRQLGAQVVEVQLPGLCHMGLLGPGLSAESDAFLLPHAIRRGADFSDPEIRYRVLATQLVSARDTLKAMRLANLLRREARELMKTVDLLITPVNSGVAFPIAARQVQLAGATVEFNEPGGRSRVTTRLTSPFNVLGMPAISIPCAHAEGDIPIGLQIIGRPFEDALVLQAARSFEREVGPGYRRPTVVQKVAG